MLLMPFFTPEEERELRSRPVAQYRPEDVLQLWLTLDAAREELAKSELQLGDALLTNNELRGTLKAIEHMAARLSTPPPTWKTGEEPPTKP
jgi:hypothetical protein